MLALLSIALAVGLNDPPAPAPTEKPKLICRAAERNLGSHIRSSRRCLTPEQWEAEDAERERAPASLTITEGQGDGQPKASQPH